MAELPIPLSVNQLKTARSGSRTHICQAAHQRRRKISVIDPEEPAPDAPTSEWAALAPGDRLWVQEEQSEAANLVSPLQSRMFWAADCIGGRAQIPGGFKRGKWEVRTHPARVLSRPESRYTLLVKAVRIFHCQGITGDEIRAEGGSTSFVSTLRPWTVRQWWQLNYGVLLPWDKNPVVVGIDFEFLAVSIDGREAPRVEGLSPLAIGETRKPPNPLLEQWRREAEERKAAQVPDAPEPET